VKPWERYAQSGAPAAGPWTKYKATPASTPQSEAQYFAGRERQAMQRADEAGWQDVRNLAGEALPYVTTSAGTALGGMMGGPPGMIAGGAAGASMGARGRQLLRGDPEPTTTEKAVETGLGAASGAFGAALSKLFAVRPNVNLSAAMRDQAKAAERSLTGKVAETVTKKGRGFKSPEAKDLYRRSFVVEEIEKAITSSRGNPYRLANAFQRVASNPRMQGRLTGEQLALVDDVASSNNIAGMLRAIGDLRASFTGAVGAAVGAATGFSPVIGAGLAGLSGIGRTLAGPATRAVADKALAGISGTPLPAALPNIAAGAAVGPAAGLLTRQSMSGGVGPVAPQPGTRTRRW
jgi:hypothetical protein